TINCTQSGIYLVRITQAPSCSYSYSAGYNFTLTGISTSDNDIKGISFYPNPASDLIKVGGVEKIAENYTVNLYNLEGRLVFSSDNSQEIITAELLSGCYLISLTTESGKSINQRIIITK
ncbi:MAG: hypothetical protein RLZZ94_1099, partial [Bacteroidota bacterium]